MPASRSIHSRSSRGEESERIYTDCASMNLTDSTCSFGLVQLNGSCSWTFASLDESAYVRSQIIYLAVGFVTVVGAIILYSRASKYDTAKLQRHSLFLCAYAALTFVFRSADPNSYKHVIPHPIVCYFSDSCTAALYTIFIMSLSYWASVIQRCAVHIQRPLDLTKYVWATAIVIWVFYLVIDLCLFTTKGYFTPLMMYLQLMPSAGVLAIIGVAFFTYGIRVRRRLLHFEHLRVLTAIRTNSDSSESYGDVFNRPVNSYRSSDSSRYEGDDIFNVSRIDDESAGNLHEEEEEEGEEEEEVGVTNDKKSSDSMSYAHKILKIVLVVSVFVVVAVAAQIYIGVVRSRGSNSEINCSNGLGCEGVKSSVSMLHWLQLAAIWVILWVNHKVEQKAESESDDFV